MYFDFEDYRPDITPVGRAISWREGILISIIVHMAMILLVITAPDWLTLPPETAPDKLALRQDREDPPIRFTFIQPRVDLKAPTPPERGEASDQDRRARAPELAPDPADPLPFARGNTSERVDSSDDQAARGKGPAPDPSTGQQARAEPPPMQSNLRLPSLAERSPSGGSLGKSLRNLGRYLERDQFNNPPGGAGTFGPAIQFDTKGVEFGPWIRRFIAQVKGNWLIPLSAMSMSGHTVLTFNVHKNGVITDLALAQPCPIEAFNHAAYGALAASNPTQPLPPEYPADRAFFTVTFFYNEQPPY